MESPISGDLMGLAVLEVSWRRLFGRAAFGLATIVLQSTNLTIGI